MSEQDAEIREMARIAVELGRQRFEPTMGADFGPAECLQAFQDHYKSLANGDADKLGRLEALIRDPVFQSAVQDFYEDIGRPA